MQSRLRESDRILVLDDHCALALHRWMARPAEWEKPTSAWGGWSDGPWKHSSRYPSFSTMAPILIPEVVEAMGAELGRAGTLIPFSADDDGRVEEGVHQVYLVDAVVDCLDLRASTKPNRRTGYLHRTVLHADRVPDLPAFRIPQMPAVALWTRPAVERLVRLVGSDVEPVVVWSLDPDLPADPKPFH